MLFKKHLIGNSAIVLYRTVITKGYIFWKYWKLDTIWTTVFLKIKGAVDQYKKSSSISEHFDGNVEQVWWCAVGFRCIQSSAASHAPLCSNSPVVFLCRWLGGTMEKWVEFSPSLMIHCWIFHRKRSHDPCSEPHQLLSTLFSSHSLPQQPGKFPSSSPKIKLSGALHSTTQQVLHYYSGCQ